MSNDRKAQFTFLSGIRKDGKYKVSLYYPGSPNMFGGYYHGRSFTKLYTADQCLESIGKNLYEVHDLPNELKPSKEVISVADTDLSIDTSELNGFDVMFTNEVGRKVNGCPMGRGRTVFAAKLDLKRRTEMETPVIIKFTTVTE